MVADSYRINTIERNLSKSREMYDNGEISREQLDRLEEQGNKRIKEIKRNGNL